MKHDAGEPHLDLLALDALRAGEGTEEERAHFESCEACKTALEELRALSTALHAERATQRPVPFEISDRIRANARNELARSMRLRRLRLPRVALAVAAALLVVALAGFYLASQRDLLDVDRDGGVNIVDAFQLARRVRDGGELPRHWDFTGDGTVDAADVDRVVRAAVALEGNGRR